MCGLVGHNLVYKQIRTVLDEGNGGVGLWITGRDDLIFGFGAPALRGSEMNVLHAIQPNLQYRIVLLSRFVKTEGVLTTIIVTSMAGWG